MLRARNENGEIIHVNEVKNRREDYYCLCCNKKVMIRKGRYNRGHFAHINVVHKHSHDFSEHQYLQNYLRERLSASDITAKLEVKINEHHRADIVCVVNSKKYTIEIQRTAITYERLTQRIHIYEQEGYQIIWVIPITVIKKETQTLSVNNWILTLLQYQQKIIFYCRTTKKFYHPYWALRITSKKVVYDCLDIGVKIMQFFYLESSYPLRIKEINKELEFAFSQWKRWFVRTATIYDKLAEILYQTQKQVVEIPFAILNPSIQMAMFAKSYFWIQVFISVLFLFENRSVITIFNICKKQGHLQQEFAAGLNAISAYCDYLENWRK